jgi:hypothetical protein
MLGYHRLKHGDHSILEVWNMISKQHQQRAGHEGMDATFMYELIYYLLVTIHSSSSLKFRVLLSALDARSAELACWNDAKASTSSDASASCYGGPENIRIVTVVLPELKFIQVEREIFLADIVIRPDDSALEQSPEAFDIVGVNFTANVLALAVVHGFMADATPQVVVALILIGRDTRGLFVDGMADESGQRARIGLPDDPADNVAFALDRADHVNLAVADLIAVFIRSFSFALLTGLFGPMAVAVFPADIGLVHFNDPHKLLEAVILHTSAEPMANIPGGMQGRRIAKEDAANLAGRNTFLTLQHRVEHLEPCFERDVCILKHSPDQNRKAIGRFMEIGFVSAEPIKGPCRAFIDLGIAATWALRAGRPAPQGQIGPASSLIGKRRHELLERRHE